MSTVGKIAAVNCILLFKMNVSNRLQNLEFWYAELILRRKGKIDYYFCSVIFFSCQHEDQYVKIKNSDQV